MAHYSDSGLQQYSIGPLYPWSVVIHKRPGDIGFARLENLVTGQKCVKHYFAASFQGFEQAHRQAELDYPS